MYLRMTCDPQRANTCNHKISRFWATQYVLPATLHEWLPKSLRPVASRDGSPACATTISIALTMASFTTTLPSESENTGYAPFLIQLRRDTVCNVSRDFTQTCDGHRDSHGWAHRHSHFRLHDFALVSVLHTGNVHTMVRSPSTRTSSQIAQAISISHSTHKLPRMTANTGKTGSPCPAHV